MAKHHEYLVYLVHPPVGKQLSHPFHLKWKLECKTLPHGLAYEVEIAVGSKAPIKIPVHGNQNTVCSDRPELLAIVRGPNHTAVRWQVRVLSQHGDELGASDESTFVLRCENIREDLASILHGRGARNDPNGFQQRVIGILLKGVAEFDWMFAIDCVNRRVQAINDRIDDYNKRQDCAGDRVEPITNTRLAELVGVNRVQIGKYLKMKAKPNLVQFCKLLRALGLRLEDIPSGDPEEALNIGYLKAMDQILTKEFAPAAETPAPAITIDIVKQLRRGDFDNVDPIHLDAFDALVCAVNLAPALDPFNEGPFDANLPQSDEPEKEADHDGADH
jgi:transcriptional regulator with XRE-family HTH domain